MITLFILGLGVLNLIWSLVALEINYRRAASMGIPLVRLPIDQLNPIWLAMGPWFWFLLDYLPFKLGTFIYHSRREWQFRDKAESHVRCGRIWAVVTPCDIYVYVADPHAIRDIFLRRGDFLRPPEMYKPLEIYGPQLFNVGWTDWPRHRKLVAAPFTENIMRYVWDEALIQATEMLHSWITDANSGITSVVKDTRTLSLNVLAATNFGRSYKFRNSNTSGNDEAQTFRDALQTVLDSAIILMIFPPRLLLLPLLPRSWARIGQATLDFKKYVLRMIDEETDMMNRGEKGTGSLMTSFVRALNEKQKDHDRKQESFDKNQDGQPLPKGLTVNEILGNIFIISFVSHDTLANVLLFSMILLAANPKCQRWVAEEANCYTERCDRGFLDYSTLFPKLKRCRAVLLETLRLYPPVVGVLKRSIQYPQKLRIGDRTIVIPPHTVVMPSLVAIQTHPKYWSDPLIWRPSRWVCSRSASESISISKRKLLEREKILVPAPGTYFPWSDGPQNCPGEKFAQVEFVAVLVCLLRNHRVEVVPNSHETSDEARKRAVAATQDRDLQLFARMRNVDEIRLVWKDVSEVRAEGTH